MDYLKDEFLAIDQLKHQKQKLKGEVAHCVLEQIGNLSEGNKDAIINNAIANARLQHPQVKEMQSIIGQINALVEHDAMHAFFYCGRDQVFTEKEIVNQFGHTKRCDRLIIKKGEVWIIDYKSTKDAIELNREQVLEYKEILQQVYPNRVIKGFLIFLENREVEEV